MTERVVTFIPGDGIGPEVIGASMQVVKALGVQIQWEPGEAGAAVFRAGEASGVTQATLASIARTRVVLKGPLETPIGYGGKSANVTLRKYFETYGNIRPVREVPGVATPYTGRNLDIVVVRENVEDLYAGIEHQQTPEVAQCLKLISTKGCEKVVRLAFEFARAEGRKRVHCATKANIMKLTEGMLKRTFEQLAVEYPEIEAKHILVDNCAHLLVKSPEIFDVIVTTNMNGDILSDLTSGLIGGLGFAPSWNVGEDVAIFEAVHGTAPTIAGQGIANPTAAMLSTAMLLRHIGELDAANTLENAVMRAFEDGLLTRDAGGAVGTAAFTEAVIARLGQRPAGGSVRDRKAVPALRFAKGPKAERPASRAVVGADIFVEWTGTTRALGEALEARCADLPLYLKIMSNRGTRVWPETGTPTDCVDHYRCRFRTRDGGAVDDATLRTLIARVEGVATWMHIEKLNQFEGADAFTKAQGET
ncbi:MAG: NADP-dependent isocitrate dehydrogenase [Myxococcales bacterium]|nr:NADP-dependent isocitrate dehydrogenase [Myxococcales bacterium]